MVYRISEGSAVALWSTGSVIHARTSRSSCRDPLDERDAHVAQQADAAASGHAITLKRKRSNESGRLQGMGIRTPARCRMRKRRARLPIAAAAHDRRSSAVQCRRRCGVRIGHLCGRRVPQLGTARRRRAHSSREHGRYADRRRRPMHHADAADEGDATTRPPMLPPRRPALAAVPLRRVDAAAKARALEVSLWSQAAAARGSKGKEAYLA